MIDPPASANQALVDRIEVLEDLVWRMRDRNQRVEQEKAWETSHTRRRLLSGLTYAVTAFVFWQISVPSPFTQALIPLTGYLISTLTIPWARQLWLACRTPQRKPSSSSY